jgi:AraC family transcriptional regulator
MEPKIIRKEGFTLAGLAHRGTTDAGKIGELWGKFFARVGELQGVIDPEVAYGVMRDFDEASGEYDYIAAVRVASGENLPAGFVAAPIPPCAWAVFTSTIPDMAQDYPYIYGTWLPASGYQHGPAPEFELYGPEFDPSKPESPVDIYVPVVKA